tara:strand:- start:4682 stop:5845 length:1164 start_codon:yes stop_codon:yes gene_type:complete
MKVPIFDLKYTEEEIQSMQSIARDILSRGMLGEGKWTKRFEDGFAEFQGVDHAIAVTSGTAALECALKAAGIGPGSEVLVPSNTFFATANAVANVGAQIVLGDMCPFNLTLHPGTVEAFIDTCPKKSAVIVVHIGGNISSAVPGIAYMCKDNGVTLIEDAAHAHGANLHGGVAGGYGDFGCFSFFPTKSMTTGEGGMVTCSTEENADKIRSVKNFWRKKNNIGICTKANGSNYKITDMTAGLGTIELRRAPARLARRREINRMYADGLKNTIYIGHFLLDEERSGAYKAILTVEDGIDRDAVQTYCAQHGVKMTGGVYQIPLHRQQPWAHAPRVSATSRLSRRSMSVSEKFGNTNWWADHHICPPNYPEMTDEQVDYVIDTLKSYSQ